MKSLSVVIPVYNEEEVIDRVILGFYGQVIKKYPNSKLIVAEDGSNDGTKEALLKLNKKIPMKLVMGEERKGYLRAVRDALLLANTDLVFFSDSDNTHDPKDFWKLFKRIGDCDIVTGVRENRRDSFHRIILSDVYNWMIGLLFGLQLKDSNVGFKLMKKEIVQNIVPQIRYLKYGFSSELLIRAHKKGMRIAEVPISHTKRRTGSATQFSIRWLPKAVYQQFKGLYALKRELG